MSGEAGAPGTAGDRYKVEPPAGRHRAPPTPPRPDRFTVPIAAAAAILTAASLIGIYAPGVAPDASAAASTSPTIGAEGAWDPETDAPIPVDTLSAPLPSSIPQSVPVHRPVATEPAQVTTEAGIDTTTTQDTPATQPEADEPTTGTQHTWDWTWTWTTTSPSPTTDAAAPNEDSSATPTTEEPVPEPTATETVPADTGDLIDQALEAALGETP